VIKYLYIALAVLLFGAGFYTAKKTIKPESQTVDRIVNKDVIRTVTRIIEHKDGTKETVIDNAENKSSTETKVVTIAKSKYHLSGGARTDLGLKPVYFVQVEKRILGNISVGLNASTDKQLGITIGLDF
jgi:hypothetical protein